jgi:hypothetical protein
MDPFSIRIFEVSFGFLFWVSLYCMCTIKAINFFPSLFFKENGVEIITFGMEITLSLLNKEKQYKELIVDD